METAYYLLGSGMSAERFGEVVRLHWGVENSLHWCLDATMNEDRARNRMDNGPQPRPKGKLEGIIGKEAQTCPLERQLPGQRPCSNLKRGSPAICNEFLPALPTEFTRARSGPPRAPEP
jgi:hypothetical protein